MKGRKPIPFEQKLAAGNPGHRPLNRREPVAEGNLCEPPNWMSEAQKAVWAEAIAATPKGLLRKIDAGVFGQWVVCEETFRQAAQHVAAEGVMVPATEGSKNLVQNPWLSIRNKQIALATKLAAQLGFEPASRSRISIDPEEQLGLFDDVLFGGRPQLVAK